MDAKGHGRSPVAAGLRVHTLTAGIRGGGLSLCLYLSLSLSLSLCLSPPPLFVSLSSRWGGWRRAGGG